jgi:DNA polymerase III alpha subunit (gram-positive type)
MYIVFDTETGGIGLDKSLLTLYFQVTDKDFQPVNDLSLAVKPDDGIYHVTGEAMGINKINLVEHDKIAIPYKKGGTVLYEFLKSNFKGKDNRMVPVGHNMDGDLQHIWDKLLGRATWESFVSYRRFDTSAVIQYCRAKGTLPDTCSGSLENIIEYFKLPKGEHHNAKYDALMTLEVLKKLLEL